MNRSAKPNSEGVQPAGRAVLCNIGRAGDTILRNAILDSVYKTYAEVTYICGRGNVELIRSDPRHDRVILFRNSLAGFGRILKAALRSRYDAYIDLKDHDSSVSLMLARVFRSRSKTGVNRPRNRPFHHDTRSVWVPGLHKVEVMKLIAKAADLRLGKFQPSLVCAPDSINWFRQVHPGTEPFNLLNVSATHPSRMWPADKWIAYLKGIALPDWPLLVNAVPADRALAENICGALPRAKLIQPRHFMDVVAAVAAARLVLTVDTGVLHACSALNAPVVVLANGPQQIREFAPLSTRQLVIQALAPRLLSDLTAEEAIAATRGRLPL